MTPGSEGRRSVPTELHRQLLHTLHTMPSRIEEQREPERQIGGGEVAKS